MAEERMLNDEILLGLIKANSGGGGGGTTDYDDLNNKPQIGGVTLSGNKSASDLGLATDDDVQGILDGQSIDSFSDVESALADKVDKVAGKVLSTNDYTDADKAIVGGVTAALASKQDVLTAGANINMTGDVVKAGVVEVVEPDMTVYGNSTESGSKTYTIETTGVYEIFYCLSLRSTVSVTLPNDANVLFENDLTVSSHPVKHIVAELHEGDTVTIAQTPSQWNAVVSGVLKLDAISVINVAHTGSIADNTITYTLPNDNKYYLVVGACVGNPTGNNAVDSTSGGTPEITRTLTGSGVRFRSVVVKGSDSPSFSFYGYDGGVASIIAYEIEFEEGNWDYNLATKNYVDTALSGKQDTLTFDDTPTDNSNNPVKSNGVYDALALKQDKTDNTLQTTDKTVVGGINELKSGFTNVQSDVKLNTQDLTTPSRTKNLLPLSLQLIKSSNTGGTWNNNEYTTGGCVFTVNTNAQGIVTSIDVSNANTTTYVSSLNIPLPKNNNKYKFGGGGGNDYNIILWDNTTNARAKKWDGSTDSGASTNTTALWEVLNVTSDNIELRCRVNANTPAGSSTYYPLLVGENETDPTYAPYIPSVESRIEAVENGLTGCAKIVATTNLNKCVETGIYTYPYTAQNVPSQHSGSVLVLSNTTAFGGVQIARGNQDNNVYVRFFDDSVFTQWKTMTLGS